MDRKQKLAGLLVMDRKYLLIEYAFFSIVLFLALNFSSNVSLKVAIFAICLLIIIGFQFILNYHETIRRLNDRLADLEDKVFNNK